MAYASASSAAPASAVGTGLLDRLRDTLQRRKVYRQTVRELNALTTRELTDLGITRSMITRVALEAAYGRSAR
jgi:uncharacterized protein YjiS (DUF1127 family)